MRIIVCENYDEMSQKGAEIIASQMILKPTSILGLATGSTPIGMYQKLVELNRNQVIDFSKTVTFNLDEYYPITPDNDQSYRYFMNQNLFNHINIDPANTHVPSGNAEDPDAECARYEAMIDASAGIDLQVLGIGPNGHIGFNEPDDALITVTHVTGLTDSTIDANARFFNSRDEVPTKALTMGMATIMKAKTIILLASGKGKAYAVKHLLDDKITPDVPATFLKLHPNVILICDKEAYMS